MPKNYVTRFHVETDLDSSYTVSTLRVTVAMSFHGAKKGIVGFRLRDPEGGQVTWLRMYSRTASTYRPTVDTKS